MLKKICCNICRKFSLIVFFNDNDVICHMLIILSVFTYGNLLVLSRSKSSSIVGGGSGMPVAVDSVYDLLNVSVPAPSNGDMNTIDNLIHLSPDQERVSCWMIGLLTLLD